ncbi:type II secretion system minor pseudopilin GspK [Phenylobacterium sp.]|uniref:type II secretion system minor pseudopilin GspK n=1 Tax=Phenylobacterium sp. TaxID=1871053 RepID=UPI00391B0E4E
MRWRDEQGVALLSVLLLVAVMSVMAVTVLDEIRFGVRRAANAEAVGQARWYALGAEALARSRIGALNRSDAVLTGWSGRAVSYPVDGGVIQARLVDAGDCFNLNSVAQGPPEGLRRRDEGVRQFVNLAEVVGLAPRQAEMLAAALVDWIDADPLRESGGAEDEAYDGYRTAGTLLAERSELRAIRGFTPEVYARLKPYVCALPNAEPAPININTLTEDQAPLLAMLAAEPMSLASARTVIAARPSAGWNDVSDFAGLPAVVQANMDVSQLKTKPRVFRLETEVTFADAEVTSSALMETDAAGRVRLVARRWGPEE